ncbi:MAG: CoA-binding protein, partial [Bdellovibrionales bacterium]|nr:CoA-binding protein [Bdellovibrionales bacterium]
MDKKTLVIGASENTDRYSNKAVKKLLENKISVVALGKNEGFIENVKILTG